MPEVVKKNIGLTQAEKYLGRLCEKSFLSLWSYPGLFRESGTELCDLLVVFENDIIIFSDKDRAFPNTGNLLNDWNKWHRKTVVKSAKQAWGAERWIKNFPQQIFLDAKCKHAFPFELPDVRKANFHLVAVAHQASKACKAFHGGSGSLMISNDNVFATASGMPFVIGDLDEKKTFVHVLDDTTLDLVMKNVDTITDFVRYLSKRERLMRSSTKILAAGEEELLSYYLKNINSKGEHDFVWPNKDANIIALAESVWENFENNPQRVEQKKADEVSYFWDSIIESFARNALAGTQYFKQEEGLKNSEKILRFLAKTSRFERRILSKGLIEILNKTPKHLRMVRCLPPIKKGDPYFVLLLFPWRNDKSERVNREVRAGFLDACCRVVKLRYPDAEDIVGIATETGREAWGSEDAAYLDGRKWTKELEEDAKKLQSELGILVKPKFFRIHEKEYPENKRVEKINELPKNPRNKKCPCGSGLKYKKCHGK